MRLRLIAGRGLPVGFMICDVKLDIATGFAFGFALRYRGCPADCAPIGAGYLPHLKVLQMSSPLAPNL